MEKNYLFLFSLQILFFLIQIKCAIAFSLPHNNLRADTDEDGVGECSTILIIVLHIYVDQFKDNIKLFKMKFLILNK